MARIRRFPAEDRHGDVVASAQVSLHLKLQIVERIEAQVVIESFMIVSVAALDFAVVPRRARADRFVRDAVFLAKQVQRMHALRLCRVAKLAAVVGLHDLRRIAEKGDCAALFKKFCKRDFCDEVRDFKIPEPEAVAS